MWWNLSNLQRSNPSGRFGINWRCRSRGTQKTTQPRVGKTSEGVLRKRGEQIHGWRRDDTSTLCAHRACRRQDLQMHQKSIVCVMFKFTLSSQSASFIKSITLTKTSLCVHRFVRVQTSKRNLVQHVRLVWWQSCYISDEYHTYKYVIIVPLRRRAEEAARRKEPAGAGRTRRQHRKAAKEARRQPYHTRGVQWNPVHPVQQNGDNVCFDVM